ncbi:MAG: NUDIX hydrolase [Acidimicrobiia bacterium]
MAEQIIGATAPVSSVSMLDVWTRLSALPPVSDTDSAVSAVLVPLYADGHGDTRVILTKRPDAMRTHPGDVVFPGGRIESGESPVETAAREAWEEIALPAETVRVLGGLSPVTTRDLTNWIVPVVARIDWPVVLRPDPAEVEAILKPTLTDLLDESRWHTSDWMGAQLWFYQFAEGTLWGATAFIVRQLLGFLRHGEGRGA